MPDVWVSAVGNHLSSVANAITATLDSGESPGKLVLLTPPTIQPTESAVLDLLKDICLEYNVDPEVTIEPTPELSNPADVIESVSSTLEKVATEGDVTVDISSGPRLITACLVGVATNNPSTEINNIYSLEQIQQPSSDHHGYPLIPRPELELIDFHAGTAKELTGPGDHAETDQIFYLQRDHLAVLFNALYSTGTHSIAVEHKSDLLPELYRIELGRGTPARIRFSASPDEYEAARSEVRAEHGTQPFSELPSRTSYVGGFTASVLDFANQEQIDEFIEPYRNRRLDQGNTVTLAVFDANLIRYWPAQQLGVAPDQEDGLNGYAVVTGVRDELFDYEGDEKINSVRALKDAFSEEFGSLFNQPKQAPRELQLGRKYFSRLERRLYTEKITSPKGDKNIIAACEEVHQTGGFDLLLFSNDSGFITDARSYQVPAQRVKFPSKFPRSKDVAWDAIATILYMHAVQFGILQLPKLDLYGIWRGKEPEHWETDTLAIRCRSPVVAAQLKRYSNLMEMTP